MKIRPEHLEAFSPKDDEEIIDFIVLHLQDESPELIDRIPLDGLREMVANGMDRARSHGLSSLANLAGFVSVMFEIAPNFDEEPLIRQTLSDVDIPSDNRFEKLFERQFDKAWEAAANSYDSDAWFPDLQDDGT